MGLGQGKSWDVTLLFLTINYGGFFSWQLAMPIFFMHQLHNAAIHIQKYVVCTISWQHLWQTHQKYWLALPRGCAGTVRSALCKHQTSLSSLFSWNDKVKCSHSTGGRYSYSHSLFSMVRVLGVNSIGLASGKKSLITPTGKEWVEPTDHFFNHCT